MAGIDAKAGLYSRPMTPADNTRVAAKLTKNHSASSLPSPLDLSLPSDTFRVEPFAEARGQAAASVSFDAAPDYAKNLPDLGSSDNKYAKPNVRHNDRGDKLEFFNPELSSDKALFSIEARMPNIHDYRRAEADHNNSIHGDQDFNYSMGKPKLRSPLLKQMLRDTGDNLIKNPLNAAWDNKDFTSTDSLKAMGWTAGVLAAAVMSPSEIKSSVKLGSMEFAGYDLGLKTSLRSGEGNVDINSIGVRLRPQEQAFNSHWDMDLKYEYEDDRLSFTYSKTIQEHGGTDYHANRPRTDLRLELYRGDREYSSMGSHERNLERSGQRERESGIQFSINRSF